MVGKVTTKLATPAILIIRNIIFSARLTCVKLHFTGTVTECISGYQHFAVNILSAFTNVRSQSEQESDNIEAQLVS